MNLSQKIIINLVFQLVTFLIPILVFGQTDISINDASCSLAIQACEGDTMLISPQNISNYTNIKWYYEGIDINNEITSNSAENFNVLGDNFNMFLPSIRIIAPGGKYIITANDVNDGCSLRPDTITISFSPKPSFIVNIPKVCPGTSSEISISNLMNIGLGEYKIDNAMFQAIPIPFVVSGLVSGNHTITIRNNTSGCENTQSFYLEKEKSKICMPISVRKL